MSDMKPENDKKSKLDERIYSKLPKLSETELRKVSKEAYSIVINNLYAFKEDDLIDYYLESEEFRKIVDSGKYTYVDGKIVLKSKECLSVKKR